MIHEVLLFYSMYASMYLYIYIYICVYVYVCVFAFAFIISTCCSVYVYIYIYVHNGVSLEVQVLLRHAVLEIGASRHLRGLGVLALLGWAQQEDVTFQSKVSKL